MSHHLFTNCIVKLVECSQREQQIADDLNAYFAPSECFGPALRGERRKRLNIIAEHGYTPERLALEAAERGLSKWMYEKNVCIPLQENTFIAQIHGPTRVNSSSVCLLRNKVVYEPPSLPKSGGRDYNTLFRSGDWVIARAYGHDRVLIEAPKRFPEMWWTR